jgi:hypothetical protein
MSSPSPKIIDQKTEVIKLNIEGRPLSHTRTEMKFMNTPSAVMNAIRYFIQNSIVVKSFTFSIQDIKSDDAYVMGSHDEILNNMMLVPVRQNVPEDSVWELNFKNTTQHIVDVPTHAIKCVKGGADITKLVNNMPIMQLLPGKFVSIPKIEITLGLYPQHAGYAIVNCCSSIPIDYQSGESVHDKTFVNHRLKFETNGIDEPVGVLKKSMKNLIDQVEKFATIEPKQLNANQYSLTFPGGSFGISELIVQYVAEKCPDSIANRFDDNSKRIMLINLISPDPKQILVSMSEYYVKILTSLLSQVGK